jgi:hypothetical protein
MGVTAARNSKSWIKTVMSDQTIESEEARELRGQKILSVRTQLVR